MMETLSETEFSSGTGENSFNPNVYVDISKYIEKIDIMKIYKSELGSHPFLEVKKILRLSTFEEHLVDLTMQRVLFY